MVNVELYSRKFKSRFEVNSLEFGVGLSTKNQRTVEFILVMGEVICVLCFAGNLVHCSEVIERFSDDFLFTIVRSQDWKDTVGCLDHANPLIFLVQSHTQRH